MEEKEFFSKIKELSDCLGINIEEEQSKKLYIYMNLLIEWNQKINLTAITDPQDIILKHFIDSITITKEIEKNSKVVDIGTGAGFPGIPLKILRDDLEIVLVDSLNKRINFLNLVIDKLGLKNIKAIHSRVEEFGQNGEYREKFDYATSRAVAKLSVLSEYMIPLVKLNGKVICMKGSEIEEEINQATKAISVLGGKIRKIESFKLPNSDISRNNIIIDKIKHTSSKYPRKPGMPSKNPIK